MDKTKLFDIIEEDCFQAGGQSFDIIKETAKDLIDSGKVKKKLLKNGKKKSPSDYSEVAIHYNAYLEFQHKPFDSTYDRRKPYSFKLNSSEVIVGLEIAVRSMKVDEKAQFLIHPDYAYGDWGCFGCVPKNATILYEVHFINCFSSEEDKRIQYGRTYGVAVARYASANGLFFKNLLNNAIYEYNLAALSLESYNLTTYEELKSQQKMLLKIYINMVKIFVKTEEHRKVCQTAELIYEKCKEASCKVPTKVYLVDAKAAKMIAEYDRAYTKLKAAQKNEPQNEEIMQEFKLLNIIEKDTYNREVKMIRTMFTTNEINRELNEVVFVSHVFKVSFKKFCEDIMANIDEYRLPDGLTGEELKAAKSIAKKYKCAIKEALGGYYLLKIK